ncbi:E3 ubiquitin-protein ligase DTX3L1 [Betta splendens]|uniref:E3 ubiquitin-protein ligase n=1 Tax=Betta splendens TaxID=158456 RepID=A0A6P7MGB7_BETSP|nr:E3 ubiquitin-protein ligase DTX3L1 [Betta splendens]XP_029005388.1 E3 ubiquitin-protein ligase DTX3L1 [Betta splendens]
MGSGESHETLHCNRYLDNKGPPSLEHQAKNAVNGTHDSVQPHGQMTWVVLHRELPGYPDDNTLQISFIFKDGIQTVRHPHPGQPYSGVRICAYLPDNNDGKKVLKLLQKAFYQQLVFTVATNSEGQDEITTSTIPLKTQQDGGSRVGGYPDPEYLKTVKKLLKEKVIE